MHYPLKLKVDTIAIRLPILNDLNEFGLKEKLTLES